MHDFIFTWGPPLMGAFGLAVGLWLLRTLKGLVKVVTAISDLADAQLTHNGGSTLLDRVASIERTLRAQVEASAKDSLMKTEALHVAEAALHAVEGKS